MVHLPSKHLNFGEKISLPARNGTLKIKFFKKMLEIEEQVGGRILSFQYERKKATVCTKITDHGVDLATHQRLQLK